MNITQLQHTLDQYTDKWISEQHVAERPYLRQERRNLEAELSAKLASASRGQRTGVLTLRGVTA